MPQSDKKTTTLDAGAVAAAANEQILSFSNIVQPHLRRAGSCRGSNRFTIYDHELIWSSSIAADVEIRSSSN